ncbi:unnamed protein product [Closterium sp. NIES-65]|nr:unnamed protein product [Closterium sp. NIES-65]
MLTVLGVPPSPFCPLLPLLLLSTSLAPSRSALRVPLAGGAATARARGARVLGERGGAVVVAVGAAEGVGVAVGVVAGVGALVAAAEAAAAVAVGVEEAVVAVALVEVAQCRGEALVVASVCSSSALVRPRRPSSFVSGTLRVSGLGVLVPVPTSYVLLTALGSRAVGRTPPSAALAA